MTNDKVMEPIDSLFSHWDKTGSPGAAVLVVKDGQIVHSKGYGFANLEYEIPISPSTVFHVASVSKQFTAMAIAILAREGRLSLDDKVQKYVPELPEFSKPITVRHLVHHVSGLRDQWELWTLAGGRMDDVINMEHLLKIISRQKELNFEPGSNFLYSNSGYTLLAIIVERVSGMPFSEYMQKTILGPLGMNDSHIHDDHQLIVKNRAYSYSPRPEGGYKKSVLNYANYGATSLFTTARDLAKWMGNYVDPKVGGPDVIRQMKQGYTLSSGKQIEYGFGIISKEYRNLKLIYHTGSDAGFRAYLGDFPEIGLGMAVLSNVSTFPREPMAMKIADIFIDEEIAQGRRKPSPKKQPNKINYLSCPGTYLVKSLGKLVEISLCDQGMIIEMEGWEEPRLLINANQADKDQSEIQGEFSETDVFYTEDKKVKVTFLSQESKKDELMSSPYQILLNTYGEDMGGQKIEIRHLTEEVLSQYAGTYYSPELETAYTLAVSEAKLVATHRRHSDAVLISTGQDQFHAKSGPLDKLNFVRNREGMISGFDYSGHRVHGLRFERFQCQ